MINGNTVTLLDAVSSLDKGLHHQLMEDPCWKSIVDAISKASIPILEENTYNSLVAHQIEGMELKECIGLVLKMGLSLGIGIGRLTLGEPNN